MYPCTCMYERIFDTEEMAGQRRLELAEVQSQVSVCVCVTSVCVCGGGGREVG